jgi:hypothetical protein
MVTARHCFGKFSCFDLLFNLLAGGLLLLSSPQDATAQGCAMCRTVLVGDDPLAQGIFWSILLLMSAPFVVAGSIGGWLLYQYWRAQSPQRRAASIVPLHSHTHQKEGEP